MDIRNYNDFVSYIAETHGWDFDTAIKYYSGSYHVSITNTPTAVKICSCCSDSPVTLSCQFMYPFDSAYIDTWLTPFCENADELWRNEYDDPFELLMEYTNPGLSMTLEEMEKFISQSVADGWRCPPDWTPQDFLNLYNDMGKTEEDEEE